MTAFIAMILVLSCLCSSASAGVLFVPGKTARIQEETFAGNEALDEVVLPEITEYIGHRAFAGSSAHYVYIPAGVQTIEEDAFDDCPNLVCLVAENSYAHEWCIAHNITWRDHSYAVSIVPDVTAVTMQNGTTRKIIMK